ncbi:MAG: hypothetical protein AMXMBFR13_42620 [Phycisphaerae bacterium]
MECRIVEMCAIRRVRRDANGQRLGRRHDLPQRPDPIPADLELILEHRVDAIGRTLRQVARQQQVFAHRRDHEPVELDVLSGGGRLGKQRRLTQMQRGPGQVVGITGDGEPSPADPLDISDQILNGCLERFVLPGGQDLHDRLSILDERKHPVLGPCLGAWHEYYHGCRQHRPDHPMCCPGHRYPH